MTSSRRRLPLTLSLVAAWLVLVAMLWLGLNALLLPDYARIEQESAARDVARAVNAVNNDVDALGSSASDWAHWDDTYAYMTGENPEFPEENLSVSALSEVRADLAALVGSDGGVRVATWRGDEAEEPQCAPAGVIESILSHPELRPPLGEGAGVVATPEGWMMVAARRVSRTDGSGDAVGALVLARRLDAHAQATLARQVRLSFDVGPIDQIAPRMVDPTTIAPSEDGLTLVGEGYLVNPAAQPVAVVRLRMPRTLYLHGQNLIGMLFGAGALGSALMLAGVGLLIGRLHDADVERLRLSALYDFIAGQSADGVLLVGEDGVVRHSSGAAAALLGRDRIAHLTGVPIRDIFGSDSALPQPGDAARVVSTSGPSGNTRHLEISVSLANVAGSTLRCVTLRDVSERVSGEERMRFLAFHDALTGLPNRTLFQDRLAQAVASSERSGAGLAVAFLDLDHFKSVNDAVGHDHADQMLGEVSRRLTTALRPGDTLARQGGDEFLLLLPGIVDAEGARGVCERLLHAVREPFQVAGRTLGVSVSIGVALFPNDGRDATTLVKNADLAMYKAKQCGRNMWQLVDGSLQERLSRIADLRSRLLHAVEHDELVLHYQPLVDPRTGRIVALEALARWQPPGEALVPPGVFIPVAEETGLIGPIGAWVIRQACGQLRAWRAAGLPLVRVGVNVSALQFRQPGLARLVRESLADAHLDASLLEIEITESVAMANSDDVRSEIQDLVAIGVGVTLDDFGTGHSSLAALRGMPIHRLKIDRAFLSHVDEETADRAVVAAIVALAHALRMEVIAEGVERSTQKAMLTDLGCDLLQGFGLFRPAPADDIAELLRRQAATDAAVLH